VLCSIYFVIPSEACFLADEGPASASRMGARRAMLLPDNGEGTCCGRVFCAVQMLCTVRI
jgi:hypothetical protein